MIMTIVSIILNRNPLAPALWKRVEFGSAEPSGMKTYLVILVTAGFTVLVRSGPPSQRVFPLKSRNSRILPVALLQCQSLQADLHGHEHYFDSAVKSLHSLYIANVQA
eukprot:scpid68633/ scgid31716/ 